MATKSDLSVTLLPLQAEDTNDAARICGLSMATDRHSMLKTAHPTKPYNHESGMREAFEYWLSKPREKIDLVKAVDTDTGQMLGVICWGKRLQDSNAQTSGDSTVAKETKAPDVVASKRVTSEESDPLDQLDALTSTHLAEYQDRIMPPGTRCMYVMTLAVHPDHQRRGIGSMLMRFGTDAADREGVFCWVHSSENAEKMYEKCGFQIDDCLEFDQDHYAEKLGIKAPDGRWGKYVFKYMIRKPKKAN